MQNVLLFYRTPAACVTGGPLTTASQVAGRQISEGLADLCAAHVIASFIVNISEINLSCLKGGGRRIVMGVRGEEPQRQQELCFPLPPPPFSETTTIEAVIILHHHMRQFLAVAAADDD